MWRKAKLSVTIKLQNPTRHLRHLRYRKKNPRQKGNGCNEITTAHQNEITTPVQNHAKSILWVTCKERRVYHTSRILVSCSLVRTRLFLLLQLTLAYQISCLTIQDQRSGAGNLNSRKESNLSVITTMREYKYFPWNSMFLHIPLLPNVFRVWHAGV